MQFEASHLQICSVFAEVGVGVVSEAVTADGLIVWVWLVRAGKADILRLTGVGRAEGRRALTCSDLQLLTDGVGVPADCLCVRLQKGNVFTEEYIYLQP